MAKPKQHKDADSPALESIRGNNPDYGDRVAQRAYELYLERGAGDGRDFDDWLTAERELQNRRDREGDSSE
jgi:hypothetical protein